ncbi:MAG TPA: chromosomal replication initiator protein DnaA [Candidatus Saccharimonadia bacterium]|nr:chromosomal replication initiator protein DnaA [Candidatus Saccharimonadia bacterium]
MEDRGLWQAVLGELEVTLTRANFATWFQNTGILSNEDGHVVVAVPHMMAKNWLEKKFHTSIQATMTKMSPGVRSIEYKVAHLVAPVAPSKPAKRTETAPTAGTKANAPAAQASLPMAPTTPNHSLNPRYTFETFVVGASNELAYAACQAVAKTPGAKYNPLFLYGGVGLGKTHLMQAVGNEIFRRDPSKRIQYVTSEMFTNEFIGAIQKKKNSAFVDKYRNIDVLIIDDMQFLAGKEATQDEFFHTFNTLHQANKQIVICSDKPPQLLVQLEDRLRSRFAMGMIADIQLPDLETRQAILQAKAAAEGKILPLDVIDYLARQAQQNIRELEGALTQLLAICEVRHTEPTLALATQMLAGQTAAKPRFKPLSPKLIIDRVAAYFDLQTADIIGAKRDKEIVVPRQIAMYLMRHEMSLSFPKIAAAVGGRDHTTAMHSVSKIERQAEDDENLRTDLQAIRDQLVAIG